MPDRYDITASLGKRFRMPGDCRPLTDIGTEIIAALSAAGYRIVKDDPEHYVNLTGDTWFIEHALDCRIAGTIGTCQYNRAIMDLPREVIDDWGCGRYRITGIDEEGLPSLVRTDGETT